MPDMTVQPASGNIHFVSAEPGKDGIGVALTDLLHQRSRVHIPGRFSCYEKIPRHYTFITSITFFASTSAFSIVAASE